MLRLYPKKRVSAKIQHRDKPLLTMCARHAIILAPSVAQKQHQGKHLEENS